MFFVKIFFFKNCSESTFFFFKIIFELLEAVLFHESPFLSKVFLFLLDDLNVVKAPFEFLRSLKVQFDAVEGSLFTQHSSELFQLCCPLFFELLFFLLLPPTFKLLTDFFLLIEEGLDFWRSGHILRCNVQ